MPAKPYRPKNTGRKRQPRKSTQRGTRVTEDSPGWNWKTMGNRRRGPGPR